MMERAANLAGLFPAIGIVSFMTAAIAGVLI